MGFVQAPGHLLKAPPGRGRYQAPPPHSRAPFYTGLRPWLGLGSAPSPAPPRAQRLQEPGVQKQTGPAALWTFCNPPGALSKPRRCGLGGRPGINRARTRAAHSLLGKNRVRGGRLRVPVPEEPASQPFGQATRGAAREPPAPSAWALRGPRCCCCCCCWGSSAPGLVSGAAGRGVRGGGDPGQRWRVHAQHGGGGAAQAGEGFLQSLLLL